MNDDPRTIAEPKRISAVELRKLSLEERNAILRAQAIVAEPYYLNDPDLTAFEAFGPDDLYGEKFLVQIRNAVKSGGSNLTLRWEPRSARSAPPLS